MVPVTEARAFCCCECESEKNDVRWDEGASVAEPRTADSSCNMHDYAITNIGTGASSRIL